METKLLAASRIHEFTDVERNVSPTYFEPRIIRAQEKYLVPVLGPLYELVCDAYRAEQQPQPVPMPDRLDELHTALEPMLGQWVYFQSLPFLNLRTTNSGLVDSGQPLSPGAYNELKKTIQTEAEDRTGDLKKWIEARRTTYPEAPPYTPIRRRSGGIVL
ncbi:DUF6712 family protein [Hymenobacter metallilatus]|uniref:Uncharacterized protein n=1 Tax=Hymenobacter metallilatus TaxID=2493666 RepID=A0A428JLY6_9BACT|nr:hypothetical protein [Hymenobacter metallilatus]RSK33963.1 hypothetical protein EI290_09665 [Hymenobacter metallilatus]